MQFPATRGVGASVPLSLRLALAFLSATGWAGCVAESTADDGDDNDAGAGGSESSAGSGGEQSGAGGDQAAGQGGQQENGGMAGDSASAGQGGQQQNGGQGGMGGTQSAPAGAPNILVILTDDQGCGDFGFMGNPKVKTPNMDRLAADGTLFTNFHTMAVCAPTRAGLLTGRAHQRTGVLGNVRGDEFMQAATETTFGEMFQQGGYATAAFGKWHQGEAYPANPRGQGFDEFVGTLGGSTENFNQDLWKEDGARTKTVGHVTEVLTDATVKFMESAHTRKKPFMIYLPYNAPHAPWEAEAKYLAMYGSIPPTTREIYAMVTQIDDGLGRILAKLKELGIDKNTLILLAGDNGPEKGYGSTRDESRFNCGLRGEKKDIYEGGLRNPLVVWQPGKIPAGKKIATPTSLFDVLPSLAEYAKLPLPQNKLDGKSFMPLINGGNFPDRTIYLSMQTAANNLSGSVAIEGKYKLVNGTELYDLEKDPAEATNIASQETVVFNRILGGLNTWWTDVWAAKKSPSELEIGHAEEPTITLTPNAAIATTGLMFRRDHTDPSVGAKSLNSHWNWLGDWKETSDVVSWRADSKKAATYDVVLYVRCRTAGSMPIKASMGGKTISGTISNCYNADMRWNTLNLGKISVGTGSVTLTLQATAAGPDVELRDVDLLLN